MDMFPQPKYKIGDTVFLAATTVTRKSFSCPDCLGSKEWKATSPAGKDFTIGCPRCTHGYMANRSLSLDYSISVPRIETLTIGSVRFDTADTKRPVSYMCRETGVGSGSVYDEQNLFPTLELAQKAAENKAAINNLEVPFLAESYSAALSVADYQLHDAAINTARASVQKAQNQIDDLFADLEYAETIGEVKDAIKKFRDKP